ncbi:hypothetical protein X560_0379 [Listeria fleischmannii 1991]|uniref:Uncharacterized protein n=1 Tax=Listeria fleischmannii 1991 TaxID=1430899 RepID=A0A0J8GJ08_9LIST|nr:hypothetical protein X560_0379 [Listeria fleischmannii 1991]
MEIEKLTKEFQTHQRVIESKLAEEGAGEGEMIEEIQNAVSKTYEFRLKLIKLHAKLIEKIFNHQFSVEEFIDGVGVDYQEVCESIYMKVLGGQSEDEKK